MLRIVDEYFVHLVLSDATRQHFGYDILQNVRVAVTAVFCEAILGVDVMSDEEPVFISFLDQKSQAEEDTNILKNRFGLDKNSNHFCTYTNLL